MLDKLCITLQCVQTLLPWLLAVSYIQPAADIQLYVSQNHYTVSISASAKKSPTQILVVTLVQNDVTKPAHIPKS